MARIYGQTLTARDFAADNKKPAEAGFSKTIPTSCRQPSGPWSIILDPAAIPSLQLMDPNLPG
jgi:hypothetical protein